MSRRSDPARLREFVSDVLRHAGAELDASGPVLAARLPEEGEEALALTAALGQRELRLAFTAEDLRQGAELVAPGSHALRVFEEDLAGRGRRAYVVLPGEERLTLKTLSGRVRAARGWSLKLEGRRASEGHDVWVVYRAHYRTRERVDALEAVRVEVRPGLPPRVAPGEPPDPRGLEHRPRKHAPAEALEQALELADAEVRARVQAEAERLGEETRRALAREVHRLNGYYAAQVAEAERGSRSREDVWRKSEELTEERELRLRELAAAALVAVDLSPIQLLELEVPLAEADLVVRPRQGEGGAGRVPLVLDRSTGQLRLAPCPACAGELLGGTIQACAAGHAAHASCVTDCARCGTARCAACGGESCAGCEGLLCPGCVRVCPRCQASHCPDHAATCSVGQEPGCAACVRACAGCGEPACANHRHEALEGSAAVFCERCALPCPGCKTATPRRSLVACAGCGRKFCASCHPRGAASCALCSGR